MAGTFLFKKRSQYGEQARSIPLQCADMQALTGTDASEDSTKSCVCATDYQLLSKFAEEQ